MKHCTPRSLRGTRKTQAAVCNQRCIILSIASTSSACKSLLRVRPVCAHSSNTMHTSAAQRTMDQPCCSGRQHVALSRAPDVAHFRVSARWLRRHTLPKQQQQRASTVQVRAAGASVAEPPGQTLQKQAFPRQPVRQPPPAQQTEKVGVLLLNLGGPETLDDVQPFLYNLFADPDIIRLEPQWRFLQPLLAWVISTLRAPKSAEGYKAIGGGSPLRRITQEQADALAASLRSKGFDAQVYVAMRYWKPFTEDALAQIKADRPTKLVVLPLYPQFSLSTSGSSLRLLEHSLANDADLALLQHVCIASWYHRAGYVRSMADLIERELRCFADPAGVEVFFSAHGVPQSYVDEGDPYKEEMEQSVAYIMRELHARGFYNHHTLAYQSRVGPVEWLKPYTDTTIRELAASGTKALLAVPISFVSEHIETLEEIDCEYRELALESGIRHWRRVPALGTHPRFIDDLADAVAEALPETGTIAEKRAGVPAFESLVPSGPIGQLMETYDRDRKVLQPPVQAWEWGWTKSAETWNGRIAMIAIIVILLLEVATGHSVLTSWMLT